MPISETEVAALVQLPVLLDVPADDEETMFIAPDTVGSILPRAGDVERESILTTKCGATFRIPMPPLAIAAALGLLVRRARRTD